MSIISFTKDTLGYFVLIDVLTGVWKSGRFFVFRFFFPAFFFFFFPASSIASHVIWLFWSSLYNPIYSLIQQIISLICGAMLDIVSFFKKKDSFLQRVDPSIPQTLPDIALHKSGWTSQVPGPKYHILVHAAFIPSTNTMYISALYFHIPCPYIEIHCFSKQHPYFVCGKCLWKPISIPYLQSLNDLQNGKLQPNVYFFGILTCN